LQVTVIISVTYCSGMVKLVLPGTMNHLRTCDMMPE